MRLGFWNRLAIVVGVLAILIAPTWLTFSSNIQHGEAVSSGYRTCIAAANERLDAKGIGLCHDLWLAPTTGYLGWPFWRQAAASTAGVVLFLYLLIWAAVSTAKWVWRGRHPTS